MSLLETPLRELLGVEVPIVQAPMANNAPPALAAAGALGSVARATLSPDELRAEIHVVRDATDRPFAVNLFAPPYLRDENLEVVLEERLQPQDPQLPDLLGRENHARGVCGRRVPVPGTETCLEAASSPSKNCSTPVRWRFGHVRCLARDTARRDVCLFRPDRSMRAEPRGAGRRGSRPRRAVA